MLKLLTVDYSVADEIKKNPKGIATIIEKGKAKTQKEPKPSKKNDQVG